MRLRFFLWIIVGLCLFPRPAHAYLDPGSGSLILQAAIAAFFAASVAVRLFWKRIKGLFSARQPHEEEND